MHIFICDQCLDRIQIDIYSHRLSYLSMDTDYFSFSMLLLFSLLKCFTDKTKNKSGPTLQFGSFPWDRRHNSIICIISYISHEVTIHLHFPQTWNCLIFSNILHKQFKCLISFRNWNNLCMVLFNQHHYTCC